MTHTLNSRPLVTGACSPVTRSLVSAGGIPPSSSPSLPSPRTGHILRVGTWNISHWSAPKATVVARDIPVDVLAVQETHLAAVPLQWAHSSAQRLSFSLHHGTLFHPSSARSMAGPVV